MAGRLIYVMGPSGAGKDTLLKYARTQLAGSTILFAHRYITRPPMADDENFISLNEREFQARLDLFAFHWAAHGHLYGIGIEVEHWRDTGRTVVISGSREHFVRVLSDRPDVTPVVVTAPATTLAARLDARGRENSEAAASRLQRAPAIEMGHPRLVLIENITAPSEAGDRLVTVIAACAAEPA